MNYLNLYLAVSAAFAVLLLATLAFIASSLSDIAKEAKTKNDLLAKISDKLVKKGD